MRHYIYHFCWLYIYVFLISMICFKGEHIFLIAFDLDIIRLEEQSTMVLALHMHHLLFPLDCVVSWDIYISSLSQYSIMNFQMNQQYCLLTFKWDHFLKYVIFISITFPLGLRLINVGSHWFKVPEMKEVFPYNEIC